MRTEEGLTPGTPATDFSVFRFNKDILSRSRIGAIATRRKAPASRATRTARADRVDAAFNPSSTSPSPATGPEPEDTGAPAADDRQSYRGQFNWNADATGFQVYYNYVGGGFNPQDRLPAPHRVRAHLWLGALQPAAEELEGRAQGVLRRQRGLLREHRRHAGITRGPGRAAHGVHVERPVGGRVPLSQFERLFAPFRVTTGVVVPAGDYEFGQTRGMFSFSPRSGPSPGTLTLTRGGFYDGTLNEVQLARPCGVRPAVPGGADHLAELLRHALRHRRFLPPGKRAHHLHS